MIKSKLKIVVSLVVAIATGYGVYQSQIEKFPMSDLVLSQVEALAIYEPDDECSGCIHNSLYICKYFPDWGGCIGDPFLFQA